MTTKKIHCVLKGFKMTTRVSYTDSANIGVTCHVTQKCDTMWHFENAFVTCGFWPLNLNWTELNYFTKGAITWMPVDLSLLYKGSYYIT